jgi:hypothetical protein
MFLGGEGSYESYIFYVWTEALGGKMLTIDNLIKRGMSMVDWCCMCKGCDKNPDHLLLHCSFARELRMFCTDGVWR